MIENESQLTEDVPLSARSELFMPDEFGGKDGVDTLRSYVLLGVRIYMCACVIYLNSHACTCPS